MIVDQLGSWFK